MKKYIGYLVAFLLCCLGLILSCKDNIPTGTFVAGGNNEKVTITISKDGKVKCEQGYKTTYGHIESRIGGYVIFLGKPYPYILGESANLLYIKDGYLYENRTDFESEHPNNRVPITKIY